MTVLKRRPRGSTELQQLTLTPALRGLGTALGASAVPRLDFQRDLRQRLIEEARLIAAQPKTRPRYGRPRRPKGGGIRLAAIGIGFSLAGGGIVAAAHSLTLPAKKTATSPGSPTAVHPHGPPPRAGSPAPLTRSRRSFEQPAQAPAVSRVAAPTSAAAHWPASASPREIASTLTHATETPSAAASAIGRIAGGQVGAPPFPSDRPSPSTVVPSWPDRLPSISPGPLPQDSPLP